MRRDNPLKDNGKEIKASYFKIYRFDDCRTHLQYDKVKDRFIPAPAVAPDGSVIEIEPPDIQPLLPLPLPPADLGAQWCAPPESQSVQDGAAKASAKGSAQFSSSSSTSSSSGSSSSSSSGSSSYSSAHIQSDKPGGIDESARAGSNVSVSQKYSPDEEAARPESQVTRGEKDTSKPYNRDTELDKERFQG